MSLRKSESEQACLNNKPLSPKLMPFIDLLAAQIAREEIERLNATARAA